jgi:hypothetical protein
MQACAGRIGLPIFLSSRKVPGCCLLNAGAEVV